jgi:hypothetical protein
MNDINNTLLRLILATLCAPIFGLWPVLALLAVYEMLGLILWLRDSESRERVKADVRRQNGLVHVAAEGAAK